MPSVMTPSPIACVGGSLDAVDVDLLVIPWFEDEAADAVAGVDGATAGELARALARREFRGCPYELFLTPVVDRKWRARRIAVVGAGRRADAASDRLRKLATMAGLAARQKRDTSLAFMIRGDGDAARLAQAAAEGLTLAEFNGGTYKTGDEPLGASPAWTVVVDGAREPGEQVVKSVARGRTLGECSNL